MSLLHFNSWISFKLKVILLVLYKDTICLIYVKGKPVWHHLEIFSVMVAITLWHHMLTKQNNPSSYWQHCSCPCSQHINIQIRSGHEYHQKACFTFILKHIKIRVQFIHIKGNCTADVLLCCSQWTRCRRLAPEVDQWPTPLPHLGHIDQKASRLLYRSLAHDTHQAYHTVLTKFKNSILLYGLVQTLPVLVPQLLQFIAYLSIKNLTYRTTCLYISAMSNNHNIQGLQDNIKHFIVT